MGAGTELLYRGTYYAVWFDLGRTQRQSLRTDNRQEAERRLIDFRAAMTAPIGTTVDAIMDAYLAEKKGRVVDHARLVNGWKSAKPTLGHLRPDHITRDICRQYAETRRQQGIHLRGRPTGDGAPSSRS